MAINKRLRVWALGAVLVALLVPAGLAAGSHDGDTVVPGGQASVIYLTMGPQDHVKWDGLFQGITTRNNDCRVVQFAGDEILSLTAKEGEPERPLGHVKDGFGVLGVSDGLGEPCGRVSVGQSISVALGEAASGYLMSAIDVDIELKFNAEVRIRYRHAGHEVASGMHSSDAGSDDGPDSQDGDNWRYHGEPGVYFDEVVFEAIAGSFTLEGGGDLVCSANDDSGCGEIDPDSKSSQFAVVPVFDGTITCSDPLPIGTGAFTGTVTVRAMDTGVEGAWDSDCTHLKLYNDFATESVIGFVPFDEDYSARYTIDITIEDQPIDFTLQGVIRTLGLAYDPFGGPDPDQVLLECLEAPDVDDPTYWEGEDLGLLSSGESACFYRLELETTGGGDGIERWGVYFEDDPSFGFK